MWNKEFGGNFTKNGISNPEAMKGMKGMKGIYYIHDANFGTVYLGKSDSCVWTRLDCHLRGSSNRRLRQAVSSGENLSFFCWESPNPSYEEALEIKRLKEAGSLKGQRREIKPLIESLD